MSKITNKEELLRAIFVSLDLSINLMKRCDADREFSMFLMKIEEALSWGQLCVQRSKEIKFDEKDEKQKIIT